MSFDARSRERLEALGRQLPRPLPAPPPPTPATGTPAPGAPALERRHPVETEQDPEKLFRALMNVSADGSVPPHLLERLRQLETPAGGESGTEPAGASPVAASGPATQALRGGTKRRPPDDDSERDLYTAFQQLLLEDDDG